MVRTSFAVAGIVVSVSWALVGCGKTDFEGKPLVTSALDAGSFGAQSGTTASNACVPGAPEGPLTPLDPSTLPSCCSDGAAHCVTPDHVPGQTRAQLATCGSGDGAGYCVPDPFIRAGGMMKPPVCKSLSGADGRCLSVCVPQVAQYKTLLPQDTCAADERCAPCVNPLNGQSTGACQLGEPDTSGGTCGADGGASGSSAPSAASTPATCPYTGPAIVDPSSFPSCFDGGGAHCVPEAIVPTAMQSKLAACSGGLCAPDDFIAAGGNAIPATCASIGNAEGRCLHVAVPQIASQKDLLPQSSCQSYERCAPCFDPRDGSATGACTLSCDNPNDPPPDMTCPYKGPELLDPKSYPACGNLGAAHCLPSGLVPQKLVSDLGTCSTGLCVPDVFIEAEGRFVPPTCKSLGNTEGRCLYAELPAVASQASLLPQSTCASYEKCTPCYDPRTGASTGACEKTCDPGPTTPAPGTSCPHTGAPVMDPTYFASCGTAAHCMPAPLVPAKQAPLLAACGTGGLCVPDTFIAAGDNYVPKTCSSLDGAEGRCTNLVVTSVAAQASELPQDTCESYERCAPCYDPVSGDDTQACRQSCDTGPTSPPVLFPGCCGGYGKCVPQSIVPSNMSSNLVAQGCASGNLCAPTENLSPTFEPNSCTGFALLLGGTYDGVCLSTCLQFSFLENIVIKEGTCDSLHRCVPCTKFGKPTGAPGCPQ